MDPNISKILGKIHKDFNALATVTPDELTNRRPKSKRVLKDISTFLRLYDHHADNFYYSTAVKPGVKKFKLTTHFKIHEGFWGITLPLHERFRVEGIMSNSITPGKETLILFTYPMEAYCFSYLLGILHKYRITEKHTEDMRILYLEKIKELCEDL